MPNLRKAIIFDGEKWHVRRIRVIEHDLTRDEKVYRCDKAISNDHPTLADVPAVNALLLAQGTSPLLATVPKLCCAEKCRRVARYSRKLSDFWISNCEEHLGAQLSVNKAIDQLKGTF